MLARNEGPQISAWSVKSNVRAHGVTEFMCEDPVEVVTLEALVGKARLVPLGVGISTARIVPNNPIVEISLQSISILRTQPIDSLLQATTVIAQIYYALWRALRLTKR